MRMEAIEDIWMLSRGAIQAGTASSHFSVLARLLAVGRAHAGAARSPVWLDAAEVASGDSYPMLCCEPLPLSDL